MHFVKLAWSELTATDVSNCIESLIKTVLGVNFQSEQDTCTPPAPASGEAENLLPFDLEPSDLKLVEQLEKQMELKLSTGEAPLIIEENEEALDEQFMGLKLIPPKKREVHAALEVSKIHS